MAEDQMLDIAMESTFQRNWAALPIELLEQILSHLYGQDVRSFHLVCRGWGVVEEYLFQKEHNPLEFPVPESQWLLHKQYSELTYEFIHPVYPNVRYAKNLLEGPENVSYARAVVRHSKDGWLLLSTGNFSIFFLCPFSEIVVDLPDLIKGYEFDGVAFSCNPTSPNCVIFIISYLFSTKVEVTTILVGENEWKSMKHENNVPFHPCYCSSPLYYKEVFYCLSIDGNLGVYNHKANTWTVLEKPLSLSPRKWVYESHLVEHEGGLMSLFMGEYGSWVSVFKLNEADMVWENVDSLKDYALFVSIPTSFSRKGVLDMMKNKIFFPLLHNNYLVFYCLETKTFRTYSTGLYENLYRTEIAEQLESCWIEPAEYESVSEEKEESEGTEAGTSEDEEDGEKTKEDEENEINDESRSEKEEEHETNNGEKCKTSDESTCEEDETNRDKYKTSDKSQTDDDEAEEVMKVVSG